ncbi:hypothetical protein KUL49_12095 [Alteromonas sp. KUL17]|nr:hypothetical protein KUL49_12095 [Alteromonas sp. KUL17]
MRQKVSCNTSINSDLLNEAKSLDIKLSEVFEAALIRAVNEKKKQNGSSRMTAPLKLIMTK